MIHVLNEIEDSLYRLSYKFYTADILEAVVAAVCFTVTKSPVYTIQPVVKPVVKFDNRLDVCLHDTAGCQTGCTNGLTTGCIV